MPKKIEPKPNRIFRESTPAESKRLTELRQQLEREKPALIAEAKAKLNAKERSSKRLAQVFLTLKAEREKRGWSLADMATRTGMAREVIHRLENLTSANPTLNTVQRYAEALGFEVAIELIPQG